MDPTLATIHTSIAELKRGAKENELSLATLKPARILDFLVEADPERTWDDAKIRAMREAQDQMHLFEDNEWRRTFRLVKKLPYKFRYRFEDEHGEQSTLRILDWEIGALYWNCLARWGGDEAAAVAQVRAKYLDELAHKKDIHLFLGTLYAFHQRSENPWSIVGVFYPPITKQMQLL